MEIKVGDYVRYVRGTINGYVPPRISKIQEIESEFYIKLDNNQVVMTNDVIKSSPDIIDLIEAGDYVNGTYVLDFETLQTGEKAIVVDGLITYGWGQGVVPISEIKSIVTKEQFESMSYKVKTNERQQNEC